jgi:hypothetical protein
MKKIARQDHEPPPALAKLGWRFHHLGIPTKTPRPGEDHVPHLKIHVSGFATSPFGIQWMRFDDDGEFPEVIRTVPHVAFEVDDLERALRQCGAEVLTPPNSPSPGVRVAMILHDGAPIELIEFKAKKGIAKIVKN